MYSSHERYGSWVRSSPIVFESVLASGLDSGGKNIDAIGVTLFTRLFSCIRRCDRKDSSDGWVTACGLATLSTDSNVKHSLNRLTKDFLSINLFE